MYEIFNIWFLQVSLSNPVTYPWLTVEINDKLYLLFSLKLLTFWLDLELRCVSKYPCAWNNTCICSKN